MPVTDQVKELNDRFYLILNQLVAIYPAYKANPKTPNITLDNLN